jgi:hypothetical protein
MLSKVTKQGQYLGTTQIKNYRDDFEIIMDNQKDTLLIKLKNKIFSWNYKYNKKINKNRIKIKFNNKYFYKQIDSFDQNNTLICNYVRKTVLSYLRHNNAENILGIGGEFYIYFPFLKYKKYIGMSNHTSIIEDANYNLYNLNSNNYLVDYENINLELVGKYDVIVNVISIHEKIIDFISKLDTNKIIIISCKSLYNKIDLLTNYFKIIKTDYYINITSIITILYLVKKQ